MAAQWKATLLFVARNFPVPFGWSESIYLQTAGLTDSDAKVLDYVATRRMALGNGASVYAYRLSDVNLTLGAKHQRNGVTRTLSTGQGDSPYNQSEYQAYDASSTSILVRCFDAARTHSRQFWITGMPDGWTTTLAKLGLEAGISTLPALSGVLKWLSAPGNAQIKSNIIASPGPPPVFTYFPIGFCQLRMVRSRKRGRPFDLLRGKRSA